jgi:hypothetical protein
LEFRFAGFGTRNCWERIALAFRELHAGSKLGQVRSNHADSMNWEMITAIAQLATVFVGIPSLIYFAIQIREQTRERRQSAVNALTVQWSDLTKALHEDGEFAAIFLRGLHSFHDLDAISKLRFSAFENRFFKNFEGMYYSRCEGILNAASWGEIERTMGDFLAYDGVRQWWETRKHWHTEAFVRVIDAIIARGDEPKAYSTYNLNEIVLSKE